MNLKVYTNNLSDKIFIFNNKNLIIIYNKKMPIKNKFKIKYITFSWDGGDTKKIKAEPNSDFSYISPNSSDGDFL